MYNLCYLIYFNSHELRFITGIFQFHMCKIMTNASAGGIQTVIKQKQGRNYLHINVPIQHLIGDFIVLQEEILC